MKIDPLTTTIGALPAIFMLLAAFGVHVPSELQNAVTTICVAIVSYYVGKPLVAR
jgi:hypothetical protein